MHRLIPFIVTVAAHALGAAARAAEIPPIDRAAPARIETATFALG